MMDAQTYNDLSVPDVLERILDPAFRALKRCTGPAEHDDVILFRLTAYRKPDYWDAIVHLDEEVRDSEELDDGA